VLPEAQQAALVDAVLGADKLSDAGRIVELMRV